MRADEAAGRPDDPAGSELSAAMSVSGNHNATVVPSPRVLRMAKPPSDWCANPRANGKPETSALARLLRRDERFGGARQRWRIHADAGIRHLDTQIIARPQQGQSVLLVAGTGPATRDHHRVGLVPANLWADRYETWFCARPPHQPRARYRFA
jgi:hypothetical protein